MVIIITATERGSFIACRESLKIVFTLIEDFRFNTNHWEEGCFRQIFKLVVAMEATTVIIIKNLIQIGYQVLTFVVFFIILETQRRIEVCLVPNSYYIIKFLTTKRYSIANHIKHRYQLAR